jgi:hypothetical protein
MPYLTRLWVGILVFGILGCASVSVKTDYDRRFDFSRFKTYNWDRTKQIQDDVLMRDPLLRKRIKQAVDQVLEEKGFVKKTSGAADFTVVIHAGVKERMRVTNWGNYGWYDTWWGPYGGRVDVSYYTQGTLVIDVVDHPSKELVWRGLGEGIVREYNDIQKMEADIYNTVAEILKGFPPDAPASPKEP